MKLRMIAVLLAMVTTARVCAFEYSVRQPSDVLRPTWFAKDTVPGVWTLNYEDALAKAKANHKYTIMLFTGSWWCPYCETLEEMVLRSNEWKQFVKDNGLYLAMLDFPYRFDVPEGQEWKSTSPHGRTLGAGWGFQCWLYDPGYLQSIGLTADQGAAYIEKMYAYQNSMALASAARNTFVSWDGKRTIEVGKVGYPTFVVFDGNGREVGRAGFPWYRSSDVTQSEAIEYVKQKLSLLLNGDCLICQDPLAGSPDVSRAQIYRGWLCDASGGIVGSIEVKTGKENSKRKVRVSANVVLKGKKVPFDNMNVDSPSAVAACSYCELTPLSDFVMTKKRKTYAAKLSLGQHGLSGYYKDGQNEYTITGGYDVFKGTDAQSKDRAKTSPLGRWNVVLIPDGKTVPALACGYSSLIVELKAKGKAKVSGTLADGTKVNVAAQAIMGENGLVCLPVVANLYTKKQGGLGFVAWFKNGNLLCFSDLAPWRAAGKYTFSVDYTPSFSMAPGYSPVTASVMDLALGNDTDGADDEVAIEKNRWKGQESGFYATLTAKTGALKGSAYVKVNGERRKATFVGIVIGGAGYGSAYIKNVGSWPVKIAVCGSCSE